MQTKTVEEMAEAEFRKYAELIFSLTGDYLMNKITREHYLHTLNLTIEPLNNDLYK